MILSVCEYLLLPLLCRCRFFVFVFAVVVVVLAAVGKVHSLYSSAHSLHAHLLRLVILNSPILIIFDNHIHNFMCNFQFNFYIAAL